MIHDTRTGTGTLCMDRHHGGALCQLAHGHIGAHMNFSNGTLAWGFCFDNTPRTGYRT